MRRRSLLVLPVLAVLAALLISLAPSSSQTLVIWFPQTQHNVTGSFAQFWRSHGGFLAFGYPLTEEFDETVDGVTYRVQYFERAVLEIHPEFAGTEYEVLPRRLGAGELDRRYPGNTQPAAAPARQIQAPTSTPRPARPTATDTPAPTATSEPDQPAEPTETPIGGTGCEAVPPEQQALIEHTGAVYIDLVRFEGDEYVQLRNDGSEPVDLEGWQIRDKNDPAQIFTFGPGSLLGVDGGIVQVFTAPGAVYSFESESPIWNDCGDALELVDPTGFVVATYAYGTHLAAEPEPTETTEPAAPDESCATSEIGGYFACAILSNPVPIPGEEVIVTGFLTQDGAPVVDAVMQVTFFYDGATAECAGVTDESGASSCSIVTDLAAPGSPVRVSLDFLVGGELVITVETSFTPE